MEQLFEHPYSTNPTSELNPIPLITDIDGDGINDIILAPFDEHKIQIFSFKNGELKLKNESPLPTKANIIFMTSGYDKTYQEEYRRKQIIIAITRHYEVLCYNPDLSLRWRQDIYKHTAKSYVQEISAIVLPYIIQKKYEGAVICAFRTSYDSMHVGYREDEILEEDFRADFGMQFDEQKGDLMNDDFDPEKFMSEHMSYFAFSGKDGQVIWQHVSDETYDNIDIVEKEDEVEKYKQYRIYSSFSDDFGEIQWHEFHDAVYSNLPHRWGNYYETKISPAHFARDLKTNPEKRVDPKDADLTNAYNEYDLLRNANVLVVHQRNGIEVVHLFTGKILLHVSMGSSSFSNAASYADLDGDDSLDEVSTQLTSHTLNYENYKDDLSCQIQAMTISNYKFMFKANVCVKENRFDLMRRKTGEEMIEILSPFIIKNPHKKYIHERPQYDILVLNSFGLVTSVDGHGKINWQKETDSKWDINDDKNYLKTFKPYLTSFEFTYGKNATDPFIVTQGDEFINVLDLNGNIIAKQEFGKENTPVMMPIFGDVNNDKNNDIIIVTNNKIIGYKMDIIPSSEFLPIFIALLILLISYNIYIITISYYKKQE